MFYPLDVVKTNRIVNSSLAKEGVESVPRELMALHAKGGLATGSLFRGASMSIGLAAVYTHCSSQSLSLSVPLITALQQPFNVLQVHKQVV